MDLPISRREFMRAAGAATLTPALSPRSTALAANGPVPSSPSQCFVGESGKRGEGTLVVGLLTTSDAAYHDLHIAYLRRRYGYPRALKYTSTDAGKGSFAGALIDYFAGEPGLAFSALLLRDDLAAWTTVGEHKDAVYASLHARLTRAAAATNSIVHMAGRPRSPRDVSLQMTLSGQYGVRVKASRADGPVPNLMQLAGFICGCVYGEATAVSHPLKLALTNRLKSRLGATSLTATPASNQAKFSVRAIGMGSVLASAREPAEAGTGAS